MQGAEGLTDYNGKIGIDYSRMPNAEHNMAISE